VYACLDAAEVSIPVTGHKSCMHESRVPDWNEYVAPIRNESLLWDNTRKDCSGMVVDMRRTRVSFHYSNRQLRKSETDIIQQRFASSILQNHNRDFCSEVKQMKNCNSKVSGIVVGVADDHR